jgi:thiol-disulfide isomerase/thioredoxin
MTLKRRLVALAGLALIVAPVFGFLYLVGVIGNDNDSGVANAVVIEPVRSPGQKAFGVGPEIGKLAPNFELSDTSGRRHRLSDFQGKVVYLNFWATWCTPCEAEMPDIFQLLQGNQETLVTIAVNRREPLSRVQAFLGNLPRNDGRTGVSFTVAGMDPSDTLYDEYRGLGMPLSVFIDASGVITFVRNGRISLQQMEEALAEAVSEKGSG